MCVIFLVNNKIMASRTAHGMQGFMSSVESVFRDEAVCVYTASEVSETTYIDDRY